MAQAGLDAVKAAKERGTWMALNEVDNLVVPPDLQQLLDADKIARYNWELFSRSLVGPDMVLSWSGFFNPGRLSIWIFNPIILLRLLPGRH